MVVEVSPSARMQVRNRGELQRPGACCVCGSGTHPDGYLDLGVDLEFEGSLYLCLTCLVQAGETIGMLSPDLASHLHDQNKQLAASLISANDSLKAANERLAKYDSIISSALNADPIPTVDAGPDARNVTAEPVGEQQSAKSDANDKREAEAKSPESGSGTGGRKSVTRITDSDSIL